MKWKKTDILRSVFGFSYSVEFVGSIYDMLYTFYTILYNKIVTISISRAI